MVGAAVWATGPMTCRSSVKNASSRSGQSLSLPSSQTACMLKWSVVRSSDKPVSDSRRDRFLGGVLSSSLRRVSEAFTRSDLWLAAPLFSRPFVARFNMRVAYTCDTISPIAVPILPLKEMSAKDKLQTMEALWESLSADPATVESPEWHENELRVRESRIQSGDAKFVDWEKSKADIRRQTS